MRIRGTIPPWQKDGWSSSHTLNLIRGWFCLVSVNFRKVDAMPEALKQNNEAISEEELEAANGGGFRTAVTKKATKTIAKAGIEVAAEKVAGKNS
ncbi:Hypothetical protein GbCGDNIH4_1524 [Granulibacter bethesdensis CGDNIH4]|nr:Hypothetical protein GbCGDNIH4_1524 [Granulibacter bethesdensis CGDNIH4]